jgi:RNA polymerase sigma factor (sigma-70 family)
MPVYGPSRLSARARDERSFEGMFKRHYAPLLSYCRHTLGDPDEAEDALQQTFIKAHRALLGGTTPREVRPWLYAIARNCCLSAIAARRPTAPLEEHVPTLAGLSDQVHQREDLRELLAGIARLPEDQRSALLLAELEDLSHQTIAGIVGCEVSKVKALVYQARSALLADRTAHNTPCRDIREQLAVARGGELRRGPLRRHLNLCAGCRDFQLAVSAQRQSLAAVLPVLPSAGLATAILGHAAAHTAGAASIGGAGGGLASASGAGVGTGATAAGGTGIAASGTAAASTAAGVGAGAGSGTSVGALVGGGLLTKLAVGGAVVALAAAGTVAIHHRSDAISRRATRLELSSSRMATRGSTATGILSSGNPSSSLGRGSSAAPVLADATGTARPAAEADSSTPAMEQLSGLSGASTPLTPVGPLTSSIATPTVAAPGSPSRPTRTPEQGKDGDGHNPSARAIHRAALRRQRELLRRKALLRREHATRRHARRKALQRKRRPVKPATTKPAVTPVPVHVRHRKARPTPEQASTPPVTTAPAETTGAGSKSKETSGKHHRSKASTGAEAGTGTTGTATEKGSSSASSATGPTGATVKKASEKTIGTDAATGKDAAGDTSTKPHPKEHPVEEEQLPNLRGEPAVVGVEVHENPTANSTGRNA